MIPERNFYKDKFKMSKIIIMLAVLAVLAVNISLAESQGGSSPTTLTGLMGKFRSQKKENILLRYLPESGPDVLFESDYHPTELYKEIAQLTSELHREHAFFANGQFVETTNYECSREFVEKMHRELNKLIDRHNKNENKAIPHLPSPIFLPQSGAKKIPRQESRLRYKYLMLHYGVVHYWKRSSAWIAFNMETSPKLQAKLKTIETLGKEDNEGERSYELKIELVEPSIPAYRDKDFTFYNVDPPFPFPDDAIGFLGSRNGFLNSEKNSKRINRKSKRYYKEWIKCLKRSTKHYVSEYF